MSKESNRKHRMKNKNNKEFYIKNTLLKHARDRAKNRGLKFNLTLEDVKSLAVNTCPVFGVKLIYKSYRNTNGAPNQNSPSIDRIDPRGGYTKNNCRIISFRANKLKNNSTPIEAAELFKDRLCTVSPREMDRMLGIICDIFS